MTLKISQFGKVGNITLTNYIKHNNGIQKYPSIVLMLRQGYSDIVRLVFKLVCMTSDEMLRAQPLTVFAH